MKKLTIIVFVVIVLLTGCAKSKSGGSSNSSSSASGSNQEAQTLPALSGSVLFISATDAVPAYITVKHASKFDCIVLDANLLHGTSRAAAILWIDNVRALKSTITILLALRINTLPHDTTNMSLYTAILAALDSNHRLKHEDGTAYTINSGADLVMNMTDLCPNANGRKYREFLYEDYIKPLLTGITVEGLLIDLYDEISWVETTDVSKLDPNADGNGDGDNPTNTSLKTGTEALLTSLDGDFPTLELLTNHYNVYYVNAGKSAGLSMADFPASWAIGGRLDKQVDQIKAMTDVQREWTSLRVNVQTDANGSITNQDTIDAAQAVWAMFPKLKLAIGQNDVSRPFSSWFDKSNTTPLDSTVQVEGRLYYRSFKHYLSLANGNSWPLTLTLPTTYVKQDGTEVTTVTIPGNGGLILMTKDPHTATAVSNLLTAVPVTITIEAGHSLAQIYLETVGTSNSVFTHNVTPGTYRTNAMNASNIWSVSTPVPGTISFKAYINGIELKTFESNSIGGYNYVFSVQQDGSVSVQK